MKGPIWRPSQLLFYKSIIRVTPANTQWTRDMIDTLFFTGNFHGYLSQLVDGNHKPSSELFFHLEAYKKRSDVFAVCHTHSSYATTVSCVESKLPPIHYIIGYGGKEVPVVPYKRFGSKELAFELGLKITDYNALLLANHGVITVGSTIHQAYQTADAVEYVARIYCQAKALGRANIIDEKEMEAVLHDFKSYGQNK